MAINTASGSAAAAPQQATATATATQSTQLAVAANALIPVSVVSTTATLTQTSNTMQPEESKVSATRLNVGQRIGAEERLQNRHVMPPETSAFLSTAFVLGVLAINHFHNQRHSK